MLQESLPSLKIVPLTPRPRKLSIIKIPSTIRLIFSKPKIRIHIPSVYPSHIYLSFLTTSPVKSHSLHQLRKVEMPYLP